MLWIRAARLSRQTATTRLSDVGKGSGVSEDYGTRILCCKQVAKAAPSTADVLSENIENVAKRAAEEAPKIADRATEQIEVCSLCGIVIRQESTAGPC